MSGDMQIRQTTTGETERSPEGSVDQIVTKVVEYIRSHKLMPGDTLPSESEFARSFGVSRPVIREAYRALASIRIIELHSGRRARVGHIAPDAMSQILTHGLMTEQIDRRDVYDIRRVLEARIAFRAALQHSEEEARMLMRLARGMAEAIDDPEAVMALDIEFHEHLAKCSRNPLFYLVIRSMRDVISETWPVGWRIRSSRESKMAMIQNHVDLAQAVVDGDQEKAARLMELHFDSTENTLLKAGIL